MHIIAGHIVIGKNGRGHQYDQLNSWVDFFNERIQEFEIDSYSFKPNNKNK